MKTIRLFFFCTLLFAGVSVSAQNMEIYVSDAGDYANPPWKILKFDENGDNPELFIEDSLVWPQDIVFLEDQNVVLISNLKNVGGYISKHDINTGDFVGYFAQNISGPTRMEIGDDSLLYVLQWSNTDNNVLRYKLDGTFVDEFTSVGVKQSIGIDWDNEGNLYVSSYGSRYVEKYDTSGMDEGRFINGSLAGPTNIWFDDAGDLLVSDYNGGSIKRFNSDGQYQGVFIDGLKFPEGVDFFPNGNILIGNGGTSAVKLFDPEGNFIEDIIPSGSGGLITPNAVVIREVNTVSVQDEKTDHKGFIVPAAGKMFLLQPDVLPVIKTLEIYNLNGVRVDKVDEINNRVWNGSGLSNGFYVAVAKMKDGNRLSQKILVR